VDGTGLISCTMMGYGISGVETSGSTTIQLLWTVQKNQHLCYLYMNEYCKNTELESTVSWYSWATGWMIGGVRVPAGAGNFFFTTASRSALEHTPASYPMGTTGSYSGGKVAGAWSYISTPAIRYHGVVLSQITGITLRLRLPYLGDLKRRCQHKDMI
jgi:hypothetical protein